MKHNLLSISQLCDKGYRVIFDESKCVIENACDGKVLFVGNRYVNVYTINIDCTSTNEKCLSALHDDGSLWHRRLGHASIDLISKIVKNELVKGLPKINFQKDRTCEACQFGKQIKTSFKSKNHVSTSKPLQLLHIDLFGPSRYASLSGKFYAFVIVDDYSRYTWVLFLANKDDAIDAFRFFYKRFKMKNAILLLVLEVIMVENLKIMHLKVFVMTLALSINFHHLGLHNKMEL